MRGEKVEVEIIVKERKGKIIERVWEKNNNNWRKGGRRKNWKRIKRNEGRGNKIDWGKKRW